MKHSINAAMSMGLVVVAATVSGVAAVKNLFLGTTDFTNHIALSNNEDCPITSHCVGCVADVQSKERTWYHEVVPLNEQKLMTPDVCFEFCKQVNGSHFYGISTGSKCYCSKIFIGVFESDACNWPCPGNYSQTCGGSEKSSMFEMYDCHTLPPIPCKLPPKTIEFAAVHDSLYYRKSKVPCRNTQEEPLTTNNDVCDVECLPGYELAMNTMKCLQKGNRSVFAFAQIEGKAVCRPKSCGIPKPLLNAKGSSAETWFPHAVSYECDRGYTLNANASGEKSQSIACQESGLFEPPLPCKKIICGTCPRGGILKYSLPEQTGNVTFQCKCSYTCIPGYSLDQQPNGPKTFFTRCQETGLFTEPQECLPVACGPSPTVLNAGYTGILAKNATAVYQDVASYECSLGFSLTGIASGPKTFSVRCLEDGNFDALQTCQRVLCGDPEDVENALYQRKPFYYNETVTYTCDNGFTKTGTAEGLRVSKIRCGADGMFEQAAPACIPVSCGEAPSKPHASLVSIPEISYNFTSDILLFTCLPGYSTTADEDPYAPQLQNFSTSCTASGGFIPTPDCVNINDCSVHSCGPNGVCADEPSPTGVPLQDYTCECDAGYEIVVEDRRDEIGGDEKVCRNINDCPTVNPCGGENDRGTPRGLCNDGLLNYSCNCATGYSVTSSNGNLTCVPVVCGLTIEVNKSTNSLTGQSADFDTPEWTYTCNEGHTLNGIAGTTSEFTVRCSSNGAFSALESCEPVSCGSLQSFDHADASPLIVELLFPQEVVYTCEIGYSVSGRADNDDSFTVVCGADGNQTGAKTCKPVSCGVLAAQADSLYSGGAEYVFPQTVEIECMQGFSTDQTGNPTTQSYVVQCNSNGTYSNVQTCKPVMCGEPPIVNFTSRPDQEAVFKETVTYTTIPGYSLDGKVDGEKSFNTECLWDLSFSSTAAIFPTLCGAAPARDFATTSPNLTYVYKETALYTCKEGYSVNGSSFGLRQFELNCTETGEFTGIAGCIPIECGSFEDMVHATQESDDKGQVLRELVFGEYALFKCKPGYAKDGKLNSTDLYSKIRCLPSGNLQYPESCVNIDDCVGLTNQCGRYGTCVDKENATGVHMNDFECMCESGFAENVSVNSRSCYNEPDCPDGACKPGSCTDLINDYRCECPEGYHRGSTENFIHDCLPNVCGSAPRIENASEPAAALVYFNSSPIEYSCSYGHTLDGTAFGLKNFTVACQADKTFTESPKCQPVACGAVPGGMNAEYTRSSLVYSQTVKYTCHEGFSLTRNFSEQGDNEDYHQTCLANGSYSAASYCLPNVCPPIPPQPHATNISAENVLVFPNYLSLNCSKGYALDELVHHENAYKIRCGPRSKLEYSSADKRCVPISCGQLPVVEMAEVTGSNRFGSKALVKCVTGYSTDQTPSNSSSGYAIACKADGTFTTTVPCKPISCGIAPVVDKTTLASTGPITYGDKAVYTLNNGYTLDCTAAGRKTFSTPCQENGTLTATENPCPVRCGVPPELTYATNPRQSRSFPENEPYTCRVGYSVDGQASGLKKFNLTCESDGNFAGEEGCKPVSCGPVVSPGNSTQTSDGGVTLTSLVFRQRALFKCRSGFSIDGTMRGETEFSTSCQADGNTSIHKGCLNMNDCEGHRCGPHGTCVDHENPLGQHDLDYHCDCDSGFKEEVKADGSKICGNIPDCPPHACLPGVCTDLVNDYKCTCPEGYFEGENAKKNLDHDCLPESCGIPPAQDHAKTPMDTEVYFSYPPVSYICDEGYSLDGSPDGARMSSVTCLENKSFSFFMPCKPVECGGLPTVDHAHFDENQVLVYKEEGEYTCWPGYSTNGTAASANTFKGSCDAYGSIVGVLQCERIACPADDIDFGENVRYATAASISMKYGDVLQLTCMPGFALNPSSHDDVTYQAKCTESGQIEIEDTRCVPINCGALPALNFGTLTGETTYGSTVQASCNAGFSLDGSCCAKTFEIMCQTTGQFTEMQQCEKIDCGTLPAVQFTTTASTGTRFEDTATYTCTDGYSLDGTVAGKKEFSITCQETGEWTEGKQPEKISCGAPPSISNAQYPSADVVFGQKIRYDCLTGYTTTGLRNGTDVFRVECTASGEFEGAEECLPVECDEIREQLNASQVQNAEGKILQRLFYGQKANFRCEPGYSTDGVVGSLLTTYEVLCQSSGHIFYAASCRNNNDCATAENMCAENGVCEDHAIASGEHMNDFSCACDSGFVEGTDGETSKSCFNIPDCPESACEVGGACIDMVNSYYCRCENGYENNSNPGKNLTDDCFPVMCGAPPAADHAEPNSTGNVVFGMQPAAYTCDLGFTTDGSPTGPTTFDVPCLWTGKFSDPPGCLPITCGHVPKVENGELVHGIENSASVMVDKTRSDPTKRCANGENKVGDLGLHVEQETCMEACSVKEGCKFAVYETVSGECTEYTTCDDTKIEEGKNFKIFEKGNLGDSLMKFCLPPIIYRCLPGYTTDGTRTGNREFSISCALSGEPIGLMQCKPIKCSTEHINWDPLSTFDKGATSELFFPNALTLTCLPGHAVHKDRHREITYDAKCEEDGSVSINSKCTPIDCGQAPNVPFGDVSGKTIFGETMQAIAHTGFSTDGSCENESKQFEFRCLANGNFSSQKNFQRISCGAPKVKHVQNYQKLSGEGIVSFAAVRRSGERLPEARYKDILRLTCEEGFRVSKRSSMDPVLAEDPDQFDMQCLVTGELEPTEDWGKKITACVPVTCSVPHLLQEGRHEISIIPKTSFPPVVINFKEKQEFRCEEGYSLDGSPSGETKFSERCLANGILSRNHSCVDIDWCQVSLCGEHGKCNDGSLTYTCTCDKGYEAVSDEDGQQSCIAIDECKTEGGSGACSCPGAAECGTCIDGILSYNCSCNEGYEPGQLDSGLEQCTAVLCEDVPEQENAKLKAGGTRKLVYLASTTLICDGGYTTDGTADGSNEMHIQCEANRSLSGVQPCLPVKCGEVPEVQNAVSSSAELSFPDFVTFVCDSGFTITGYADGAKAFNVQCQKSGDFSELPECLPVSCGMPPEVYNADLHLDEAFFGGEAIVYTCKNGYTTTGRAGSNDSFAMTCSENGTFVSQETTPEECVNYMNTEGCGWTAEFPCPGQPRSNRFKRGASDTSSLSFEDSRGWTCCCILNQWHVDRSWQEDDSGVAGQLAEASRSCLPVTCGIPERIAHASMLLNEMVFGTQVQATCDSGFEVDGKLGENTFALTCGENGTIHGAQECVPVKCNIPEMKVNATRVKKCSNIEWTNGKTPLVLPPRYWKRKGEFEWCRHSKKRRRNKTFCEEHYLAYPGGEVEQCLHTGKSCRRSKEKSQCESHADKNAEGGTIHFDMVAEWRCMDGFSVDGKPTGPNKFSKRCLASGTLDETGPSDCIDINFCVGNPCSANGACVDGGNGTLAPGYNCTCFDGFVMRPTPEGPTCGESDCVGSPCGEGGICTDLVKFGMSQGSYTCECSEGYEESETESGKPTCVRSVCSQELTNVSNAVMAGDRLQAVLQRWSFDKSSSVATFLQKTKLTRAASVDACKQKCTDMGYCCGRDGACGRPSCHTGCELASSSASPAACFEKCQNAQDICELQPTGLQASNQCASCKSEAGYGGTCRGTCEPEGGCAYACGMAILYPSLDVDEGPLVLKSFESATLFCKEGFSTDGSPERKTFEATCDGTGSNLTIDGNCQRVHCESSSLTVIDNAEQVGAHDDGIPYVSGETAKFKCHEGHTLSGTLHDVSEFQVPCRDDGTFAVVNSSCIPIRCRVSSEPNVLSSEVGDVVYGVTSTFTCIDGYVVGGGANTQTSYSGTCSADGTFSIPSSVGKCKAAECGKPPLQANARMLIARVDRIASIGLVSCHCQMPHATSMIECSNGGSHWCSSNQVCSSTAPFPYGDWAAACSVDHGALRMLEVLNRQGLTSGGAAAAESDAVSEALRLLETDGTPSFAQNTWKKLTAALSGAADWKKNKLLAKLSSLNGGNSQYQRETRKELIKSLRKLKVALEAEVAHSQSDNRVKNTRRVLRQQLLTPRRLSQHARNDTSNSTRQRGSEIRNQTRERTNVTGAIEAALTSARARHAEIDDNSSVVPRSTSSNAENSGHLHFVRTSDRRPLFSGSEYDMQLIDMPGDYVMTTTSKAIIVQCKEGYTVSGREGARTSYEIHCNRHGSFEGISQTCAQSLFQVNGRATDATTGRSLSNVLVVYSSNNEELASAVTNGAGLYTMQLPKAPLDRKVSRESYITEVENVNILGSTRPGEYTDASLSKKLPPGEWRVKLDWGAESRDLDAHAVFGNGVDVCWRKRRASDRSSGISAALDLDDVTGYGPETTTFKGVGKCKVGRRCMIAYIVDNYSYWRKALGASNAKVVVFRGDTVIASYEIPPSVGSRRTAQVLTIDATEGVERVYPGAQAAKPQLLATGNFADWRTSFNQASWSTVGQRRYVSSMVVANVRGGLNQIAYGGYKQVMYSHEDVCQDVQWGLGSGGWSQCPLGSYVNGFHRIGRETDIMTSMANIDLAKCCRPKEINAPRWENCVDIPAWSSCGKAADGRETALIGMHRKRDYIWDELMQEVYNQNNGRNCYQPSNPGGTPLQASSGEECALACAKKPTCLVSSWESTEGRCREFQICNELQAGDADHRTRIFKRIRHEPLSVVDKFRCCSLRSE